MEALHRILHHMCRHALRHVRIAFGERIARSLALARVALVALHGREAIDGDMRTGLRLCHRRRHGIEWFYCSFRYSLCDLRNGKARTEHSHCKSHHAGHANCPHGLPLLFLTCKKSLAESLLSSARAGNCSNHDWLHVLTTSGLRAVRIAFLSSSLGRYGSLFPFVAGSHTVPKLLVLQGCANWTNRSLCRRLRMRAGLTADVNRQLRSARRKIATM